MEISALQLEDIKHLPDLQPIGWGDIIPKFEAFLERSYCFPIKGIQEGKIVGLGAVVFHHDVAWLANIITHPNFRKQGIGNRITQHLIGMAKQKKCKTIFLCATKLGKPVYTRLGFTVETTYLFYKDIHLADFSMDKNIIAIEESMIPQILAFDQRQLGENRMNTLNDHLLRGFAYFTGQTLEGFYLPTLGEGTIVANTSTVGLALMKYRLKSKNIVAFPMDNEVAKEFMDAHDFNPYKIESRMSLGVSRAVNYAAIFNRIAGKIG